MTSMDFPRAARKRSFKWLFSPNPPTSSTALIFLLEDTICAWTRSITSVTTGSKTALISAGVTKSRPRLMPSFSLLAKPGTKMV